MSDNNNVFLPVRINRLNTWPGHLPATQVRLRAILDRAAVRCGGATLAERALYAVCDFWSAVAMQTLERHLGVNPEGKLQSTSAVYRAMGAKRVAGALNRTLAELSTARTCSQRQQCICALESLLLRSRGPVDELIGRFALRLLPQPGMIGRRPLSPAKTVSLAAVSNKTPPGYVRWRTEIRAGQ